MSESFVNIKVNLSHLIENERFSGKAKLRGITSRVDARRCIYITERVTHVTFVEVSAVRANFCIIILHNC